MRSRRRTARRRPCYGSKQLRPAWQTRASRRKTCREQSHHFVPIMSAASCAPRRSRTHAQSASRARSARPSSRKSRTAKSRRSSGSRKRSASSSPPTANSAASWWHFDFFGMLDGVEIYELDHGIQFQGVQTKPRSIKVTGKIGFSNHPMLEHFKFLKAHTKVTPKMTHSGADRDAFPARARRGRQGGLRQSRRDLRRSRRGLSERDQGVLRRRLPLSAVRRHRLGLSVLAGRIEEGAASAASTSIICRKPTRAASTRRWRPNPPT